MDVEDIVRVTSGKYEGKHGRILGPFHARGINITSVELKDKWYVEFDVNHRTDIIEESLLEPEQPQ